jgi:hypothetical protein
VYLVAGNFNLPHLGKSATFRHIEDTSPQSLLFAKPLHSEEKKVMEVFPIWFCHQFW